MPDTMPTLGWDGVLQSCRSQAKFMIPRSPEYRVAVRSKRFDRF